MRRSPTLGKITQTRIIKLGAQLGVDILGADGMLGAPDGSRTAASAPRMVFSPASSIYGGTDEIQRNIIAERTLGLPREPLPGKGQPYGEFLRSLRPDRYAGHATVFVSVKISRPSMPHWRPMPDCL